MESDRDLPPLPIRPPYVSEPTEPPVAESSRRHSHRSKATTTARDAATLFLIEQREHRETQRELSRVTELLRRETLRANEAENNVELATQRLKSVHEARLAAVREAARANESLELYKFQLETAQHEIHRAQSVFNIVERERYQAELAGAKSRTVARRLNERHKINLAREEGRRMGMRAGLEAAHLGILADGGETPAPSNFGDTQAFDYFTDADFENERLDSLDDSGSGTTDDLDPHPLSPSPPSIAPPERSAMAPPNRSRPPSSAPPAPSRDTPAPLPVPPPPVPATAAAAPLSPLFTPFHDIHPIPLYNEAPHPRHEHIDIPPDGYIPSTGPDGLVQIPPAHEFTGSVVEGVMSPRHAPSQRGNAAPSIRARERAARAHRRYVCLALISGLPA
ncbi:hypothetical protein B0H14DRAFT_745415 [Mycena olivaceomarginata]|nr:hypothetical protein B0H14DRAFT_745415 [Mycena olivaceomarginata]